MLLVSGLQKNTRTTPWPQSPLYVSHFIHSQALCRSRAWKFRTDCSTQQFGHQLIWFRTLPATLLASRNVEPVIKVPSANKMWPVINSPYHTQSVDEAVKIVVHITLKKIIT